MAKHLSAAVTSTAYKITKTVVGIECDICGKIIPVPDEYCYDHARSRYYEVTTGHHDWGNDSIDSIETVDVCPDCVNKYISDYLANVIHSNSAYLKVYNKLVYGRETSEVIDTPPKDGEITVERHDDF